MYLIRHLTAVVLLPFVVTVLVPAWIARRSGIQSAWPAGARDLLAIAAGLPILGLGVTLFGASLLHVFRRGRGTLAPWDPPRRLVVSGPYRYVRNPMIAGVLFVLFGEAIALRSPAHLAWAMVFLVVNAIYIPAVEEPALARRFGADYVRYRAGVRRFLPRLAPWDVTPARPGSRPSPRPAGPPED